MIFLRSLFFNIFLFGGIAVACIIAFPLLFLKDKHMICAGKILSRYVGFLLKIFIDVKIHFKGTENLNKFENILSPLLTNLCSKLLRFKQLYQVQFLF